MSTHTHTHTHTQDSIQRLSYLLDVHMLSKEELAINKTVMGWPSQVADIFEEGERIIAESRTRGEAALREKQEKIIIEIEKVCVFSLPLCFCLSVY